MLLEKMTEDLATTVVLKNNRLTKPKDCDADIASGKASPDSCETSKDCSGLQTVFHEIPGFHATYPGVP
ncbi:hypothetical protein TNCV_530102 [Trichonephila clavipes]|nr:hypothetical protein TNCV_530102 [Trichonephila clavipes]